MGETFAGAPPSVRTPEDRLDSWKENMADDKSKTGGQDRGRINVHEDYELRDWSKKFGVNLASASVNGLMPAG
jgi:hypothetical protein